MKLLQVFLLSLFLLTAGQSVSADPTIENLSEFTQKPDSASVNHVNNGQQANVKTDANQNLSNNEFMGALGLHLIALTLLLFSRTKE